MPRSPEYFLLLSKSALSTLRHQSYLTYDLSLYHLNTQRKEHLVICPCFAFLLCPCQKLDSYVAQTCRTTFDTPNFSCICETCVWCAQFPNNSSTCQVHPRTLLRSLTRNFLIKMFQNIKRERYVSVASWALTSKVDEILPSWKKHKLILEIPTGWTRFDSLKSLKFVTKLSSKPNPAHSQRNQIGSLLGIETD